MIWVATNLEPCRCYALFKPQPLHGVPPYIIDWRRLRRRRRAKWLGGRLCFWRWWDTCLGSARCQGSCRRTRSSHRANLQPACWVSERARARAKARDRDSEHRAPLAAGRPPSFPQQPYVICRCGADVVCVGRWRAGRCRRSPVRDRMRRGTVARGGRHVRIHLHGCRSDRTGPGVRT